MVASDTVVGVVGAIILVAALVGVFVYEANQGPAAPEITLDARSYAAEASGSTSYTPAETGNCQTIPNQMCAPQQYTLDLEVTGLPEIRGTDMQYAAFVQKSSGNPLLIDVLSRVGQSYQAQWDVQADHRNAQMVLVTLESTASPTAPGHILMNATVASDVISGSANVTLAGDVEAIVLQVTTTSNQTRFQGSLNDLPVVPGFDYQLWIIDETAAGSNFTLVESIPMPGNLTAGDTFPFDLDATVGVIPQNVSFSRVVISLEIAGSQAPVLSGMPVWEYMKPDAMAA